MAREKQIEEKFIEILSNLKYSYRSDICDRQSLEQMLNLIDCLKK